MTYLANVLSVTILITAGHSTTLASGTSVSSADILTQGDYCVMFVVYPPQSPPDHEATRCMHNLTMT